MNKICENQSTESANTTVTYPTAADAQSDPSSPKTASIEPRSFEACGIRLEKVCNLDADPDKRYSVCLIVKNDPRVRKAFFMGELQRNPDKLSDLLSMTGGESLDPYGLFEDIKMRYRGAPVVLCNSKIGIDSYDGHPVYKWNGVIGVDNESRYIGHLPLGSGGGMEEFTKLIRKYVLPKAHLSLMMILAIYGVVLDIIIGNRIPVRGGGHDMRLIANYVGGSSIGKSTGSLLAASVAGMPLELLETFNNTDLKLADMMFEYASIPLIIDEFTFGRKDSRAERKKKLRLLFMLHFGKQRGRVNLNPSLIKNESSGIASNAVIISTEDSILESLDEQEIKGHKARLLEIPCQGNALFDSKDDCERFAEGIASNYGWGDTVIRHILKDWPGGRIADSMNAHCDDMKLTGSAIQVRFAKRIALIHTVGEIINEALGVCLDLDAVEKLLISCVDAADRESYPNLAYNQLCSYVEHNPNKFCSDLRELVVLKTDERDKLIQSPTYDQTTYEPYLGAIIRNCTDKSDKVIGDVLYICADFLEQIVDGKCLNAVEAWDNKGLLLSCTSDKNGKRYYTRKETIKNRRMGLYKILMQ